MNIDKETGLLNPFAPSGNSGSGGGSSGGGESVDLSFITAKSGDILSGKVGADKDGNLVNGSIQTVTPSLSGNKFTVEKGYVPEAKELTVPVVTATLSKNVATVPVGYIANKQELTVPEAEAPTVNGNTVTIHPGYIPAEKTVETEGGGSMEFYKCAEVVEATESGYIISGCGYASANGTYTPFTLDSNSEIRYKNENNCYLAFNSSMGWSILLEESGEFYTKWEDTETVSESLLDVESWYDVGGEGGYPVITAIEGNSASWSGYLYNTETKEFSDTLTEGLEYKMAAPIVGQVYNADATIRIDLYTPEGLVFYAPFNTNMQDYLDTTFPTETSGNVTLTTVSSKKCAYFDGNSRLRGVPNSNFPTGNEPRTLSLFFNIPENATGGYAFCYGNNSNNQYFGIWIDPASSDVNANGNVSGIAVDHPADTWCHVTMVYDSNLLYGYLNGELKKTTSFPTTPLNTTLNTIDIGGRYDNSYYVNIYISECKVWNRVLSADEIKAEADRCLAMVTE